jgi:hypothetical protein
MNKSESEIVSRLSSLNSKYYGVEDRLSKQEAVIEKLIKEMSGIHG